MTDYIIYAIAPNERMVLNAIEDGEWYSNSLAAASVADQFTHLMIDGPYKVFKITIQENG